MPALQVIRLWTSLNEVGRAWVVGTYLHLAGFEEIVVKDLTPDGGGDPIFVVTGVRPR